MQIVCVTETVEGLQRHRYFIVGLLGMGRVGNRMT